MATSILYNSARGTRYELDKEIRTGDYWIDGKPIYARVFKFRSNGNDIQKSEILNFDELVAMKNTLRVYTSDTESFYRCGNYNQISVHINQQRECCLENNEGWKVDSVIELLYTKVGGVINKLPFFKRLRDVFAAGECYGN